MTSTGALATGRLCALVLITGIHSVISQSPTQATTVYFAPYLNPGELPNGTLLPLMREVWTIMGADTTSPSFAAEVDTIAYNFWPHTQAAGIEVGQAAPTYLDGNLVDPVLLETDAFSTQMLQAYNSINVHVNVSIDNKANQPDLGNVARTNHNRLTSRSVADGFNVTAWLCTDYYLEQPAVQIEHRMPITQYRSYRVELAVTGGNLVPMTLQKQNVVIAVVADILAYATVWYIKCIGVKQSSPAPGSANSTAVVSLVVQQDANAQFVGEALTNVINDSLGPPLFDVKTAAANLPLSASIYSISNYPGVSITDQIAERYQPPASMTRWKIGVAGAGGVVGLLLLTSLALLLLRRRSKKQHVNLKRPSTQGLITNIDSSNDLDSDVRLFKPIVPKKPIFKRLISTLQRFFSALKLGRSPAKTHTAFDLESGSNAEVALSVRSEMTSSKRKPSQKLVRASIINPAEIQICKTQEGGDWLLGMGSYGMVYKAKMGDLDVAVKTINRQHVNPQLTSLQALQVMQQELKVLATLPFDKNVVQFHGSFEQSGNILLVLEYMQGGDLRQALRGPSREALGWYQKGAQLALDVIKGLHFLHCHGVLHRDIKSGNVLLSKGFASAKICDVGLAHIMGNTSLSSSASLSSAGYFVQTTFAYAAPEMLLCLRCDERADIFSYGVVLWELITHEQARRGQLREFQVPEECPQAVSDLVDACLDQEAANRPTAQQIFGIIQSTMIDSAC